jgi:hypothetical protein
MKGKTPLFTATLVKDSPRYVDWHDILDSDEVPLESSRTQTADLGDEKNVQVYKIDIRQLRPFQRDRLAAFIEKKFNYPMSAAYRTLDKSGFPIRAEDVTVCMSPRAFL